LPLRSTKNNCDILARRANQQIAVKRNFLMVRRRASAVSNHGNICDPSFETRASARSSG
jgi:hypothetical protein